MDPELEIVDFEPENHDLGQEIQALHEPEILYLDQDYLVQNQQLPVPDLQFPAPLSQGNPPPEQVVPEFHFISPVRSVPTFSPQNTGTPQPLTTPTPVFISPRIATSSFRKIDFRPFE